MWVCNQNIEFIISLSADIEIVHKGCLKRILTTVHDIVPSPRVNDSLFKERIDLSTQMRFGNRLFQLGRNVRYFIS